jgi:hypothetical protein
LQHLLKIEGFVLFGEFFSSGRVGDGRVAGRAVANQKEEADGGDVGEEVHADHCPEDT